MGGLAYLCKKRGRKSEQVESGRKTEIALVGNSGSSFSGSSTKLEFEGGLQVVPTGTDFHTDAYPLIKNMVWFQCLSLVHCKYRSCPDSYRVQYRCRGLQGIHPVTQRNLWL